MRTVKRQRLTPDSNDFRLFDETGEDLGRIEGETIVYPEKTALKVVQAFQAHQEVVDTLARTEKELAMYKARLADVKCLDLTHLSRREDQCRTALQLPGWPLHSPWVTFGACEILKNRFTHTLQGLMHPKVVDFEKGSPSIVYIELIGLKFVETQDHTSFFSAFLSTDPDKIQVYPQDFDPANVEGARELNDQWVLPSNFRAPKYEFARAVAGGRVSIAVETI